jgi:hypothetical protein
VLPANTTLDQFEIEYAAGGSVYWWQVYSTTLDNLWSGSTYRLRARAKCYAGFTEYFYIDFAPECVDINSFSITRVDAHNAYLSAYDLGSFEVQYSAAGKDQWIALPEYSNQIFNLMPGTTYDLRFRGRCSLTPPFVYKQFTTLCPNLSSLTISGLTPSGAVVNWRSDYTGPVILEYSANNTDWNAMQGTQTLSSLTPGKQYFVRARISCADVISEFSYVSFTTPCPTVSLSANAVTPFGAQINWVDNSHADNYTLTYSIVGSGTATTVNTTSTSYNLVGLKAGTPYTVAVAAQCIATKQFASITFNTVCYVPSDLSVNSITHTTAQLSWKDAVGGLPYSVDYSIVGSSVWSTTQTPFRQTAK